MATPTQKGAAAPSRAKKQTGLWAAIRQTSGVQRAMLLTGVVIVALFVVMALGAQWIAPFYFTDDGSANGGAAWGTGLEPNSVNWFGTTTGQGLDVFSQVIYGARTAVLVIVLAVVLAFIIGVPLGLVSGYVGGWFDRIAVLISDALFSFPSLLLAIVVSISLTGGNSSQAGGILSAAISLTVVYFPQYFRVVRNATISARETTYVEAARALGAGKVRIMRRYVLGNVIQSVPIIATVNAGDALLTLAGLGFLGFGIEPTSASEWGYQLNQALSDMATGVWWTGMFPGLAIVLLVLGISLIGESLNDVLNPLLRARRLTRVVMPGRGGQGRPKEGPQ
ncbi:ABC transporter permease [Micrococcales bacterium 31B]|nr:ABC transporter permease [Micrococcales bacterium 31B]